MRKLFFLGALFRCFFWFAIVIALLLIVGLALSADAADSDPKQLFESVWEGYRGGKTIYEKEDMWMVIIDGVEETPGKREVSEVKKLTQKRWGVKKFTRYLKYDIGLLDKMYINFTFPPRDNGTQFLIWRYPDKKDDVWMYARADRRIRRLASPDQEDHFMGSAFTYEDIRHLMGEVGAKIESFSFEFLDNKMIQMKPIGRIDTGYSERRFKTSEMNGDKTSFIEIRYYKKGELAKIQQNWHISYQNGPWRPLLVEMYDAQEKFSTILYFSERELIAEKNLPVGMFEERYLRAHGR